MINPATAILNITRNDKSMVEGWAVGRRGHLRNLLRHPPSLRRLDAAQRVLRQPAQSYTLAYTLSNSCTTQLDLLKANVTAPLKVDKRVQFSRFSFNRDNQLMKNQLIE